MAQAASRATPSAIPHHAPGSGMRPPGRVRVPEAARGQRAAWRRAGADPEIARLLALVTRATGISEAALFHESRSRAEIAAARQMAMYLMNVVLSHTFSEIGALFGRDRSTVRHACCLTEDRRDDAAFDRLLSDIEAEILEGGEARHGAC